MLAELHSGLLSGTDEVESQSIGGRRIHPIHFAGQMHEMPAAFWGSSPPLLAFHRT